MSHTGIYTKMKHAYMLEGKRMSLYGMRNWSPAEKAGVWKNVIQRTDNITKKHLALVGDGSKWWPGVRQWSRHEIDECIKDKVNSWIGRRIKPTMADVISPYERFFHSEGGFDAKMHRDDRKSVHKIGCSVHDEMCCDARYRITSVNASWPGSVHDSRIFRSSALCDQFENGQHDGFLLGDSGYPCRKFLLTPFLNPGTPSEIRYNTACCRTRVLVEQTFGVLKRRFQVLHQTIRTTPESAVRIVMACAALHNIGINQRDIFQAEPVEIRNDRHPQDVDTTQPDGNLMRRHLVESHFS